jgi:hypothetical protein
MDAPPPPLQVIFIDSAGVRWRRDTNGNLDEWRGLAIDVRRHMGRGQATDRSKAMSRAGGVWRALGSLKSRSMESELRRSSAGCSCRTRACNLLFRR